MAINIEQQASKYIKPLVPTPETLRRYKTGFIDELAPPVNVSVVLFFSKRDQKFVTRLEQSLAKTLTKFYPLAGRYIDESKTIDCNDEGVEFIHAKVNIKLQDNILVTDQVDVKVVDKLIPIVTGDANPLLAVQATVFECGGVTLGVSVAHRVFDASSLCTFINEWAVVNKEENGVEFNRPSFNSAELFPGRGFNPVPVPFISEEDMSSKYVRKIYSFSESEILKMKAKAANHRWSRVQLVSGVVWKALIGVDVANNNPRGSILLQSVSLREKTTSLIPKDSWGNLWGFCGTGAGPFETTEELADRLTANVRNTVNNLSKVDHNTEEGQMIVLNSFSLPDIPQSTNVITLTSWCKFPFYEADFGFGKPTWVSPGCVPVVNASCLMDDAQGNGVEAHVLLEAKDVAHFEKALQVASFAA
ncbi:hypothetical protein QVD17_03638 [Tagetes erecta]|uniref:Transferase n=1 Tax=Tagetes erecta TaxID=13708 RepID=A0AAD8P8V0_TARER|nr:hypothetical protein QVD17_03638 [Tagetes erecta]